MSAPCTISDEFPPLLAPRRGMFDNVGSIDGSKRIVWKRPGSLVVIVDHIRLSFRSTVKIDGTIRPFSSAAQIQHVGDANRLGKSISHFHLQAHRRKTWGGT